MENQEPKIEENLSLEPLDLNYDERRLIVKALMALIEKSAGMSQEDEDQINSLLSRIKRNEQ